jgi:two-component system, sensor histidine kinase and response regulator
MNDNEILIQLTAVIASISKGRTDNVLSSIASIAIDDTNSETVRKLYREIALFSKNQSEAKEYIFELSQGNLNMISPKGNHLIDPFKELHSNLRHLVWQTQQIAQGDYSQHIDFLGDFSVSFNSLIAALKEKKVLEEELRESAFFFKESQRAAYIGSYKTDFVAGFWESSEVLDQIFGIDKSYNRSITGWLEIIHPDEMELLDRYLKEDVFLKQKPFNREYRIVRKSDGEIRWVHGLGEVAFDTEGNILSMIGTIQDITERRQIDENLVRLNQQLKELNATKDKFFSIIAHDLKSPFNSIIGFSDILKEQVQANDYKGIGKYAEIISKSSKRAMDLLVNLLEWSLSQTEKMVFNPEYVEIVSMINETTALLDDVAHQKAVRIVKELPHNLPAFADKAMVSTIMRNLISNAIKFTLPGGTIRVNAISENKQVEISISDNGVGMNEETRERLFKMEENVSTNGTANEKGSGLGLILCKEFVEKHDGKIWVTSKPDKGSSFHFTLPYNNRL